MTTQEAIELIRNNPVAYPNTEVQEMWDEAIIMAIEALKKQIPQKGNNPDYNYALPDTVLCPNCGELILKGKCCYCCGQAIDLT